MALFGRIGSLPRKVPQADFNDSLYRTNKDIVAQYDIA
jgi:hypothetical protein